MQASKMQTTTVDDCRIIQIRMPIALGDKTGLSLQAIPFLPKRIYYLYGVPSGAERGSHAHVALHQLVVAPSGRFDVHLDDGRHVKTVTLDSPATALAIVPGIWRDLKNFSTDAICLVFASEWYDEADYIRDYDAFCRYKEL